MSETREAQLERLFELFPHADKFMLEIEAEPYLDSEEQLDKFIKSFGLGPVKLSASVESPTSSNYSTCESEEEEDTKQDMMEFSDEETENSKQLNSKSSLIDVFISTQLDSLCAKPSQRNNQTMDKTDLAYLILGDDKPVQAAQEDKPMQVSNSAGEELAANHQTPTADILVQELVAHLNDKKISPEVPMQVSNSTGKELATNHQTVTADILVQELVANLNGKKFAPEVPMQVSNSTGKELAANHQTVTADILVQELVANLNDKKFVPDVPKSDSETNEISFDKRVKMIEPLLANELAKTLISLNETLIQEKKTKKQSESQVKAVQPEPKVALKPKPVPENRFAAFNSLLNVQKPSALKPSTEYVQKPLTENDQPKPLAEDLEKEKDYLYYQSKGALPKHYKVSAPASVDKLIASLLDPDTMKHQGSVQGEESVSLLEFNEKKNLESLENILQSLTRKKEAQGQSSFETKEKEEDLKQVVQGKRETEVQKFAKAADQLLPEKTEGSSSAVKVQTSEGQLKTTEKYPQQQGHADTSPGHQDIPPPLLGQPMYYNNQHVSQYYPPPFVQQQALQSFPRYPQSFNQPPAPFQPPQMPFKQPPVQFQPQQMHFNQSPAQFYAPQLPFNQPFHQQQAPFHQPAAPSQQSPTPFQQKPIPSPQAGQSSPFVYYIPDNRPADMYLPSGYYYVIPDGVVGQINAPVLGEDDVRKIFQAPARTPPSTTMPPAAARVTKQNPFQHMNKPPNVNGGNVRITKGSSVQIGRKKAATRNQVFCNQPLQTLEKREEAPVTESSSSYGQMLSSLAGKVAPDMAPAKQVFEVRQLVHQVETDTEERVLLKTIEEQYSNALALFPNQDSMYLRRKVEECAGDESKYNDLIQKELSRVDKETEEQEQLSMELARLIEQLPSCDPNYLRDKWLEFIGDERKMAEFIADEKTKMELSKNYAKLLNNLPNADPAFIRRKATEFLGDENGLDEFVNSELKSSKIDEQYRRMVELLPSRDPVELRLSCDNFQGDEYEVNQFIKNELAAIQREAEQTQMDTRFASVAVILPDIDPEFLQTKYDEVAGNMDVFNNIVYDLFDSKEYPKVAQVDPATAERMSLWRRYVEGFSVESFLEKVPSPVEKFETPGDRTSNATDDACALRFLQNRYRNIGEQYLQEELQQHKSLTNCCGVLDTTFEPETGLDMTLQNEKFSEAFLLEVVYITHRRQVQDKLRMEKEVKNLRLLEARERNELLVCGCCFDDELLRADAVQCPEGHVFCRSCLIKATETQMGEGKSKLECLSNCDQEFSFPTLERVLPETVFRKFLQHRQADEISEAKVPGLEECPFCDFVYIPPQEDKIFKCQSSTCLKESCRLCKEPSHVPLRCEEVERPKDVQVRTLIEEQMTAALVRTCPKCAKKIVKMDGCNKVACSCSAIICYVCRQLLLNGNAYEHFNGQGGTHYNRCPLWSNNDDLHLTNVRAAGIRARDDALRTNPDVHLVHDPTADFN